MNPINTTQVMVGFLVIKIEKRATIVRNLIEKRATIVRNLIEKRATKLFILYNISESWYFYGKKILQIS